MDPSRNTQRKIIYLSSLPRSGSTWVGRAIAETLNSRMINEPFNWRQHPEREQYHMQYLRASDKISGFCQIIDHHINSPLPWINDLWFGKYKVIKDVHSCLALENIWEIWRPQIFILVRHPCGMAASWAKLGMQVRFRLDLLLGQPNLINNFLRPFKSHLLKDQDYFFQIGAYWGAAYYIMAQISKNRPQWQWATHEALCIDSEQRYRQWFVNAGINLPRENLDRLAKFILNQNRESQRYYSAARLTAQEPDKWKKSLSDDQIKSCLTGAAPFELLEKFYNSASPFITGSLVD